MAPGLDALHPFLAVIAILALAIGAGAAGAVNMWYDRDIDAIMNRTKERPIPAGKIPHAEGLAFAIIMCLLSVMMMGLALNWVASGLLAFAILFYAVIYTMWLKRSTPQNIVIGGAAGAFPPMIGWAAVTGSVTIEGLILFAIIFFWTPPHFWALSLFANSDYKAASIPMMTVTHGAKYTKIQMIIYTLLLFAVCLCPYFYGMAGWEYLVATCILNGLFILSAIQTYKEKDGQFKSARLMFGYSIFYLFAIFTALIVFG